jgi:TonB-dependent receptor
MFLVAIGTVFAQTGSLKGKITEAETDNVLPFANVVIVGTTIGSATDLEGNYLIRNIPVGEHIVKISYVGYQTKTQKIIVLENKTLELNVALTFQNLEGEEILVTAQAQGQLNAVNEQLNSNSIVNVVSADRIRELPDANAAESIGRLPGVSVLRNGGEGNKVVIRGLSPQYNAVNINGVRMAASGSGDRSSDLSMISPYMLEGIEVSKAVTADQDADVLGGSVNFKIKKAPKQFKLDALLQGGYNGIASSFKNYKLMTGVSNRFFDNSLGVFAQIDLENRNRSSHEFGANYAMDDLVLRDVYFTALDLEDISREKQRYGATLVLDYDLEHGNIVLSNFGSKVENAINKHIEKHVAQNNVHSFGTEEVENSLSILMNSLEFNYNFGALKLNTIIANSFSENKTPYKLLNSFEEGAAYDNIDQYGDPQRAPETAKNSLANTFMQKISMVDSYNKETETTVATNLTYDFSITDDIGASLKFGGKYKHKNREYDKNEKFIPINWGGRQEERDLLLDTYPWMKEYWNYGDLNVPITPFIDKDYTSDNFLDGAYSMVHGLNLNLLSDVYKVLENNGKIWYSYPKSLKDDYKGYEDYSAAYASVEFTFGPLLTVIPGIRYENNRTSYTANRGDETVYLEQENYKYHDTTIVRKNEFWFPNLHIRYKPLDWMNIKFAYTNTLTRPSYAQISPKWNITQTNVSLGNPFLKPATSTNYDLNISIYENYVGLLAIGGFLKKIDDLIFFTGKRAIIDRSEFGLPPGTEGSTHTTFINNNYTVDLWGIETEWQTHFWYLPGFLSGFVLNVNYTHIFSEAKYPKTIINSKFNPNGPPFYISTNIDTFYTNRLINQPDDIVNVSLGYDYKDFSARLSLLFQSNIFKKNDPQPELKGYTENYWRWDLVVNQKLPLQGLMIYLNFNNITGTFDRAIVAGPKFPTSEQHYSYTIDFGLRYNL